MILAMVGRGATENATALAEAVPIPSSGIQTYRECPADDVIPLSVIGCLSDRTTWSS